MEIVSSWVFWVILASIVFVLALIGYLTESMKKTNKIDENKDVKEDNKIDTNVVPTQEKTEVTEVKADDWTTMPKINKPLEEVKVDNINEVSEDKVSNDNVQAPVAEATSVDDNSTITFDSPENTDMNVESLVNSTDAFSASNNEMASPALNSILNSEVNANSVNVEMPDNTTKTMSDSMTNVNTSESVTTQDVVNEESETPVETLNTSVSDAKNTDIWNL